MLKTLKILGDLNLNLSTQQKDQDRIIFFNIDLQTKELNVETEDFSISKKDLYLFQGGDQKGSGCAFLKTISKDIDKKFDINLIKSKFFGLFFSSKHDMFNKILEKNYNIPEIVEFCNDIKSFINSSDFNNKIKHEIQKIKDKINEMKAQKVKKIFSGCKINGKYLGEIEIQGKRIFYNYYVEIYQKNKFNKGKELTCFCCHQNKPTSPVSPFAFHTFDKPGYSINFDSDHMKHVSYPICYDCYQSIKNAWEKIENNPLSFGEIKYYIFPKFLFCDDNQIIEEIFKDIYERYKKHNRNEVKDFEDDYDVLRELSKKNDVFFMDFVFLVKDSNGNIKIQLYIEDVYPSRLRKIIEANDKVFEKIKTDYIFTIYDEILYFIFAETQKSKENETVIKKSYLYCLNCIFKNIPIDTEWMYKWFIKYINKKYVDAMKSNNMKIYGKALKNVEMVCQFLRNLNLLRV